MSTVEDESRRCCRGRNRDKEKILQTQKMREDEDTLKVEDAVEVEKR